jgi:hypothetical protein
MPLRRTAAYDPGRAGGRSPGDRRPWPCARESRGAACGRCCSAEKYASRSTPRQPKAKPERCIGRAGEAVKRARSIAPAQPRSPCACDRR